MKLLASHSQQEKSSSWLESRKRFLDHQPTPGFKMIQGLLVTVCLAVFPYQGSSIILEAGNVNDYEVVYPQKIHPLPKSRIESEQKMKYEDTMKYEFKVNGEPVVLHLEKNRGLFSKDYTETHYSPDDREITTSPPVEDHCYYHGRIQNDIDSTAVISVCDGLKGQFRHQGETYLIEPLKLSDSEAHAIYKYENVEKGDKTHKICGVTSTNWKSNESIKKTFDMSVTAEEQNNLEVQKYLELFLVVDNSMFNKYSHNTIIIRKRVFDMINYINVVYKALGIHVTLNGLEIWSIKDKFVVNESPDNNLSSFSKWRESVLLKRKTNDNAQLLTAVEMNGGTLGYAFMRSMCDSMTSSGVVQDYTEFVYLVAATMAHEIGHNLGMDHDSTSCTCEGGPCIMASSGGQQLALQFSSCSLMDYQDYMMDETPQCVMDKPSNTDILKNAVCGNFYVEEGEECDCGSPEECANECCDAATCQLKSGAECAEGACCEECQIKKAGEECREARDDCDLPELCTGQSAECPIDRFQINGHPCLNNKGFCFRGNCPTLANQCTALWGPDAKVAPDECFEYNRNGNKYGYCRKENDTNIPCEPENVKCGRLYCTGGTESPTYGEKIFFGLCKGSYFELIDDVGMVDPITKCGEGKACHLGNCVDLQTALG
ncbi:zinc metalloproteinase-disintegrin-like ohanin [Thamnophis elegans]|uniref:zinc metalloproteinase-disintegrin-like ohanin n=1 Tax=Thamnophis elegans TaxID=35005 RepID=UPI001377A6DA|nr:zinc metalloproteinase-disintegrin-like ohanin [Thamnophis elegans]